MHCNIANIISKIENSIDPLAAWSVDKWSIQDLEYDYRDGLISKQVIKYQMYLRVIQLKILTSKAMHPAAST